MPPTHLHQLHLNESIQEVGTNSWLVSNTRLLPRSVFQSDDLRNQTWAAYKDAVDQVRHPLLLNSSGSLEILSHFLTHRRVSSSPASTSAVPALPSIPRPIPQSYPLGAIP